MKRTPPKTNNRNARASTQRGVFYTPWSSPPRARSPGSPPSPCRAPSGLYRPGPLPQGRHWGPPQPLDRLPGPEHRPPPSHHTRSTRSRWVLGATENKVPLGKNCFIWNVFNIIMLVCKLTGCTSLSYRQLFFFRLAIIITGCGSLCYGHFIFSLSHNYF